MSENLPLLSKSRFLAGLQCPLRLWYQCFNRELATPVSPMQQSLFDTGHKVGQIATERYPSGILIEEDYMHHEAATLAMVRIRDVLLDKLKATIPRVGTTRQP